MRKHVGFLAPGIFAILLALFFPVPLSAYDYEKDTIFHDDFTEGTLENWEPVLGDWLIDDAKLCQLSCSS